MTVRVCEDLSISYKTGKTAKGISSPPHPPLSGRETERKRGRERDRERETERESNYIRAAFIVQRGIRTYTFTASSADTVLQSPRRTSYLISTFLTQITSSLLWGVRGSVVRWRANRRLHKPHFWLRDVVQENREEGRRGGGKPSSWGG